ncbi:class E sortase [Cellulomonas soli]|uniref:class E sortase n=1 Tax=Cellulomonas soli TaxID=931535 RepID=UPI003F850103
MTTAAPPRHSRGHAPSSASTMAYGAVGVIGELLITAGVVLLAFLAWQLWWTDVQGNRAQAAVVEDLGWEAPTTVATAAPTAPAEDTEPPVMVEPDLATTFATLQVPRWSGEPERPISQGIEKATVLDVLGIGHYPGTAMPGGVGNFAVAGHRATYGKPFNRIQELQVGDALVVRTQDTWYVYRVTSTEVVTPQDVRVIAPVPDDPAATPTERLITLTTCHPMFSARERYVVHGVLDHWSPVADGTPAELTGGA